MRRIQTAMMGAAGPKKAKSDKHTKRATLPSETWPRLASIKGNGKAVISAIIDRTHGTRRKGCVCLNRKNGRDPNQNNVAAQAAKNPQKIRIPTSSLSLTLSKAREATMKITRTVKRHLPIHFSDHSFIPYNVHFLQVKCKGRRFCDSAGVRQHFGISA
jgi:hypothetical protein